MSGEQHSVHRVADGVDRMKDRRVKPCARMYQVPKNLVDAEACPCDWGTADLLKHASTSRFTMPNLVALGLTIRAQVGDTSTLRIRCVVEHVFSTTFVNARPHSLATYLRQSLTSACLLSSILRALICEVARPMVNWLFTERYVGTDMQMSRFNIQEHKITTEFSLYSSPRPITFSPGAAVAVAARLLWVALSCQSIRGRIFLPRELSTNSTT